MKRTDSALLECLMLDVDGVLIKGRPLDGKHWTYSLKNDLDINPDDLSAEFFSKEWSRIIRGEKELVPVLSSSLRRIKTDTTAEELISYWFKMDSKIVESVLLDCRMARAVGFSVYLTTNQEHMRANYLMDTLKLQSEVDGIIYSAQVGEKKPNQLFFEQALKITGCKANQLILVDDTEENIKSAAASGWNAIHWMDDMRIADILDIIPNY